MNDRIVRFEFDPELDHVEVLIRAPSEDGDVARLLQLLKETDKVSLTVFDGKGTIKNLDADEIVLASVTGKLINIVTEDGLWYMQSALRALEEMLDENSFLRISRYELVNLNKVKRYDFTVAGTLRLELRGGLETWASRRCIPAIRKRLLGKE